MRHYIYFSSSASTSGKALAHGDLMKAGRMDIVIHSIISAFFLSHSIREDVVMHLVFYGMPDPPKHIEIHGDRVSLNKRDVAKILSKALYKGKDKDKKEVIEGIFVEKKSFLNVVEDLLDEGKEIFVLDKKGEDIRDLEIEKNKDVVFVLGDQDGLPQKEMKRLKKELKFVTIGPKIYFASQTIAIVNNELDRRE